MSNFDLFIQIGLAFCGVMAIYLVNRKDKLQKWGPVFGILGQPFWFYAMWHAEQWVPFFLSFIYLYSWVMGFYNMWIVAKRKGKTMDNEHVWSGWPGAYCLKCGAEDALENALGMGWYDSHTDSFISEHHKKVVLLCNSNCSREMGLEDFAKVKAEIKDAEKKRVQWENDNEQEQN
jgi:hypothetical protein